MSAWGVGRESGSAALAGDDGLKTFVDRVIRWIPGDVLAFYTVGITLLASQDDDANPSLLWLVIAAALCVVLVLLGAYKARKAVVGRDYVLAALAVAAFAIWSLAIPVSGWYEFDVVVENPGWVGIIAGVGGILFGAVADTFAPSQG